MLRRAAMTALSGDASPNPRRALVLATNFGPMETLQWSWRERLDTGEIDDETFAPANGYIARLAEALGCGGPAMQLSMSCASGAAAVAAAWDMLALDRADEKTGRALIECALQSGETCVTGRMVPKWLEEKADYLSLILAQKHPYINEKLPARKGVEW